jgi:hypothetical protein
MSRKSTRQPGESERRKLLSRLIFPSEPRSLPGRRGVKISLRAAHVLCSGVAAGAYLLPAGEAARGAWLGAVATTGLAILLLDLFETGVFLVQVRGLVTLTKIGLLAALPLFQERAGWLLAALVIVSVLSSHTTSKVRYFVIFGRRRLKGAETRG